MDFSQIFHLSSKDHLKGHPPIGADDSKWPDEWKTTYYKSYPRLPKVSLTDKPTKADLFETIRERTSRYDLNKKTLALDEISSLLKYSCGNTQKMSNGERYHRAQPSGGARFPIEVYPIVFRSGKELEAGLYHYNVKEHALDVLWKKEFTDKDIGQLFVYPWVKDMSVAFVMTAVFWRNQNKYGERGYRYILFEAGHIAQNVYLISEAFGLKCCALGGTKDEDIEKLIGIDGITESVVYGLVIGG